MVIAPISSDAKQCICEDVVINKDEVLNCPESDVELIRVDNKDQPIQNVKVQKADEIITPSTVAPRDFSPSTSSSPAVVGVDQIPVPKAKDNSGMIAGIVIGAVAATLLLVLATIALIVLLCLRKRFKKNKYFVHDTQTKESFLKTGKDIMEHTDQDYAERVGGEGNDDDTYAVQDDDEDNFGDDEEQITAE